MGERLSLEARMYNKRERALARKQGRKPDLIQPILPIKREELAVKEQRKQPTSISYLTAGSKLSDAYSGINYRNKNPADNDLNDRKAVEILEELEDGIRSHKIINQMEIAKQIARLGNKIGSVSTATEINIAAWRVLDAIKENRDNKLAKQPFRKRFEY